jgi:hypothetical protein
MREFLVFKVSLHFSLSVPLLDVFRQLIESVFIHVELFLEVFYFRQFGLADSANLWVFR